MKNIRIALTLRVQRTLRVEVQYLIIKIQKLYIQKMQGFFISTPPGVLGMPFGTLRMPFGVLQMPLGTFRLPSGTLGMALGIIGMPSGTTGTASGTPGMPFQAFRPPSERQDPRPNVPTGVGMMFLQLYLYCNLFICSRLNQILLQNQKSIKFVVFL